MTLPNFFIVGAAKSGTTSLYHYLSQHPEVYMSKEKEPAYFNSKNKRPKFEFSGSIFKEDFKNNLNAQTLCGFEEYLSLFEGVRDEKAIGEATVDYLSQPETPDLIFKNRPEAKIIVLLRNPYDTAYSDYLMKQRDGVWNKGVTFLDVLKAEDLEEKDPFALPNLIRIRFYSQYIEKYIERFSSDQVKVFLFEDLENPSHLLEDCFKFLEVSTDFEPDFSIKHNSASAISSSQGLYFLLKDLSQPFKERLKKVAPRGIFDWYTKKREGVTKFGQRSMTKCPAEEKEFLKPILNPEILELQRLINRNLSHWLD